MTWPPVRSVRTSSGTGPKARAAWRRTRRPAERRAVRRPGEAEHAPQVPGPEELVPQDRCPCHHRQGRGGPDPGPRRRPIPAAPMPADHGYHHTDARPRRGPRGHGDHRQVLLEHPREPQGRQGQQPDVTHHDGPRQHRQRQQRDATHVGADRVAELRGTLGVGQQAEHDRSAQAHQRTGAPEHDPHRHQHRCPVDQRRADEHPDVGPHQPHDRCEHVELDRTRVVGRIGVGVLLGGTGLADQREPAVEHVVHPQGQERVVVAGPEPVAPGPGHAGPERHREGEQDQDRQEQLPSGEVAQAVHRGDDRPPGQPASSAASVYAA